MNPKAKIAIPAIVALIFVVIDFVAPVQYLSYFHTVFNFATRQTNPISLMLARITYITFLCYLFAAVSGLLRGFRPRLRWGLSILSVVGLTSALTELSVMISISQAVNFTTLILNVMIVTFLLFTALLALLIWVRAKKEFDQRQADLEEEEVVVTPMPLATEGAEVAPVVPVTTEATAAPEVTAAPEAPAAPAAPEAPAAPAAPEAPQE